NLVDNVRPTFRHFVDPLHGYAGVGQVLLCSSGRDNLETGSDELPYRLQDVRFVAVLDRDEQGAAFRQYRTFAELRLDISRLEIPVDSHDFPGGLHFGRQDGVRARETGEREHRFFHGHVADAPVDLRQIGELLACHHARRDLGDGLSNGLGDERHRTARPRVDLYQVNRVVLNRELDVHQPLHAQCQG